MFEFAISSLKPTFAKNSACILPTVAIFFARFSGNQLMCTMNQIMQKDNILFQQTTIADDKIILLFFNSLLNLQGKGSSFLIISEPERFYYNRMKRRLTVPVLDQFFRCKYRL